MPLEIINLVSPVFLVIITGFFLGRIFHIFESNAGEALVKFSFYVAVPALLLLVLTTTPIENILHWRYTLVYGGGTLAMFILMIFAAKILFNRSLNDAVILGALSSLTNMGFIGLPLMLALFGHKAVAPATLSILLLVVIFYPLVIILIESNTTSSKNFLETLKKIFLSIIKNPIILPAIIGIIFSSLNLTFPTLIENYFKVLEGALTPCALFAIGLGIEADKVKGYLNDIILVTIIKLFIMPVAILFLGNFLNLSEFYTVAAVIAVAIPPAKSIYIMAGQYNHLKDESAAAISFATLISVISLFLWLLFLAHLYPQVFN